MFAEEDEGEDSALELLSCPAEKLPWLDVSVAGVELLTAELAGSDAGSTEVSVPQESSRSSERGKSRSGARADLEIGLQAVILVFP